MLIKILGVDLGKFSCHVVGQDQQGKVVEKRKIPIGKFAEYLANLPPCAVFLKLVVVHIIGAAKPEALATAAK